MAIKVILEGRAANSDEPWGTIKDFSTDASIVGKEKAAKMAQREAYEWYVTYPRMETRVMEEWLIGPGS